MANELREHNNVDFEQMHKILDDIQILTLGIDPIRLMLFYRPLQSMLLEARRDASNPEDSFLYGGKKVIQHD